MKRVTYSDIISTGLAIFSMLFGAGNLMYPIEVGMRSGSQHLLAIAAFIVTAVLFPVVGLISMLLFNGDYDTFFNRLGNRIGQGVLFVCFLVVGPLIAIPRIVTLSHTMIAPFIPWTFMQEKTMVASAVFSVFFLGITGLASYRENRIVSILGNIISPLLLGSLTVIIVKGILTAHQTAEQIVPVGLIVKQSLVAGYETLDLLGAIFFSSIILHVLKNTLGFAIENNYNMLISVCIKAGIIGTSLLGIMYVGLSVVGAYHGAGLSGIHPDMLFREIAFAVTGHHGAAIIGTAVLMACLSTSIALAAVVAEYTQKTIFYNRISYPIALLLVLISCVPLSVAGLGHVRHIAGGPLVYVGYPVIIALTVCNIAYKTVGFKPVKVPVWLTFIVALLSYLR